MTTTQPKSTAQQPQQAKLGADKAPADKAPFASEKVFKFLSALVISIMIYCIPGFLRFRQHCISKSYYVFSYDSFAWVAVGSVIAFTVRYSYYYLMRSTIDSIVIPKYKGEERVQKVYHARKMLMDSTLYITQTIIGYSLFRTQYWFPSIVGGSGCCDNIFREYPNWPTQGSRQNMEIYFSVQLGVHTFSVIEMLVFRYKDRKFWEYLLHHFIAASLIMFSMMCNAITVGIMILIIHDGSNILVSFMRFFVETKYSKPASKGLIFLSASIVWISVRNFIYPICFLQEIYQNSPSVSDEWYIIKFELDYLFFLNIILAVMHIFWSSFMVKGFIIMAKGKELTNQHEKASDKPKNE